MDYSRELLICSSSNFGSPPPPVGSLMMIIIEFVPVIISFFLISTYSLFILKFSNFHLHLHLLMTSGRHLNHVSNELLASITEGGPSLTWRPFLIFIYQVLQVTIKEAEPVFHSTIEVMDTFLSFLRIVNEIKIIIYVIEMYNYSIEKNAVVHKNQ